MRTARLLCTVLGLSLLLGGCLSVGPGASPEFREVLLQGEGSDKLLLIDISGPITNRPTLIPSIGVVPGMTARVRQELELAYNDPGIHGILLRINSPGGTLTDSDVIYHSLMEFKRSKDVKIVAALGDIAASGAVYVAMAADEIYAHPTTITGSIGVVMPHLQYAELAEKLGIESDPIKSAPYKDLDSPFRERMPEEQEFLQSMVDDQHQKFLRVIEKGRPQMSRSELERVADGRLISAQIAQQRGLIDEVGYLDDAYKRLAEMTGFPRNRLVRYANPWMTGSNIYSAAPPVELFGN